MGVPGNLGPSVYFLYFPPTSFSICSWSVTGTIEEAEPLPRGTLNMGQDEKGQREFQGKEQMVLGLKVKNQNPETQILLTLPQKSSF